MCVLILLAVGAACTSAFAKERVLQVGSKAFTESVILAEIADRQLMGNGIAAEHRRELGGTRVLWNALLAGDIDVYPEYTGTLLTEIFKDSAVSPVTAGAASNVAASPVADSVSADSSPAVDVADIGGDSHAVLIERLRTQGVGLIGPLGFNNTYALGMRSQRARQLGVEKISDLNSVLTLRVGLSNEFMARADGWPGLKQRYALLAPRVQGLQHDLAYRALLEESIDVTDLYSTDAEIGQYDLLTLRDDRHFFPDYAAVLLYRLDLPAAAVGSLRQLQNRIDAPTMIRLNSLAKLQRQPESRIATDFLRTTFQGAQHPGALAAAVDADSASRPRRIAQRTLEHLTLVAISLFAGILTAIPLGILAARRPRIGNFVVGAAGILQTVPSLALLAFLIPWLGIGRVPAIFALYLYSLLPILRNTQNGLLDIPWHLRESAEALGLSPGARLRRVELPLAARSIIGGIKTAAVIDVGTATLGALIGAGGYGQPILTGIRLADTGLILEGAVPAAVLALVIQGLFSLLERHFRPPDS